MRTFNTLKNSMCTLLFQIIVLAIGLIVPRWVILVYGSDVNGLTSNVNQILNIINLLQAGLVGASIYEMYRPIAENDYDTVGKIYYSSQRYFNKVSLIFFALSLLIIPYILFGKKSSLTTIDVICAVVILGANATFVFRYYCNYDAIFSAHQKKYLLIIAMTAERIIYYSVLFFVLHFKLHYLCMYIAACIGSLVRVGVLHFNFKRLYEKKICAWKKYSGYKVKNQYHLLGNQVIQNVIESAPTIIVTAIYGLKYASALSVYLLVTNIFKMLFSTFQNAVAASFGDLISQGDNEKIIKVFNIIQFVFSAVSICMYFCLGVLLLPFVNLYCENVGDMAYIYETLSIGIVLYITLYSLFLPFNLFINSAGMYGKVLRSNVIVGVISLLIMACGCWIDFEYIYFGVVVFYLFSIMHRYFIIKLSGFEVKIKNILSVLIPIFIIVVTCFSYKYIYNLVDSWGKWIAVGVFCFCVSVILTLVYGVFCCRQEWGMLKKYAKALFHR